MDLKVSPAKQTGRLRINKQFYVISLCFIISAIFWLLIALSRDYSTKLTFPVKYINLPGKKVVMNEMPTEISVIIKATGFKIMSYSFQDKQKEVEVDIASSLRSFSFSREVLSIPTNSFLVDFSKELGKGVTITGFQPDSIVFNFSDIVTKRIPVVLELQAGFEKQFDTSGSPRINPSTIEVSGPPFLVDKLNSITTEKIKFENLKETAKGKVKLVRNRLLSYDKDEVEYTIPVEKFTEGFVEVNIRPVNVREGYSLKTFPDVVKVRYLVALSNYNKVSSSMFDAVVNAGGLNEKNTTKMKVSLVSNPSFVRVTILEPEKVDYILRKQ